MAFRVHFLMRQRASTRKDTQGDTRDKTENRRHTAWKDQTQREHTKRRHTSSSRRRARSHIDGGSRAAHSLADGSAFNAVIRMQYGFEGRVFALHGGWTSTRTLDTQGGMHPPRRTSTNTATTHSPDRPKQQQQPLPRRPHSQHCGCQERDVHDCGAVVQRRWKAGARPARL